MTGAGTNKPVAMVPRTVYPYLKTEIESLVRPCFIEPELIPELTKLDPVYHCYNSKRLLAQN